MTSTDTAPPPAGQRVVDVKTSAVREWVSNLAYLGVWNAGTGQPIDAPLTGHTDTVESVVFSPRARAVATAAKLVSAMPATRHRGYL